MLLTETFQMEVVKEAMLYFYVDSEDIQNTYEELYRVLLQLKL